MSKYNLTTVCKRKVKWIGKILTRNCLHHSPISTRDGVPRNVQLLDDLKGEKEKEARDRARWSRKFTDESKSCTTLNNNNDYVSYISESYLSCSLKGSLKPGHLGLF